MSAEREHFSSKLGFILAAAGSAVGIGNLVGFPVAAAKNGGGAFLFIYALFVIINAGSLHCKSYSNTANLVIDMILSQCVIV